jgi:hypothetical protein
MFSFFLDKGRQEGWGNFNQEAEFRLFLEDFCVRLKYKCIEIGVACTPVSSKALGGTQRSVSHDASRGVAFDNKTSLPL